MGLKAETEGFIMAKQDQSIHTRNDQARIMKNVVDPYCRLCDKYDETVDYLVSRSGYPTKYKIRHDRVGKFIHWKIFPYGNKLETVAEIKCREPL